MNLLTTQASIEAAISTMNSVASDAAKLLAHRLLEDGSILQAEDRLQQEWLQACAVSAKRAGMADEHFEAFVENHGDGVANVAISIALFVVKEQERKKKWGWLGTAAAVVGGAALGVFFS